MQKVCVAYIKENSNVIAALVCKYSWRFQNVAQFNFIYYKTFEPEIVWFHWLCFVDLKNAKVEHYNLKIFSLEVFFFSTTEAYSNIFIRCSGLFVFEPINAM